MLFLASNFKYLYFVKIKTFWTDFPTPVALWFCFITSFLKDWCVWTWCCQKGWLRGQHRDGSCNSDCGSTRHQSWWHISFLTSTPSFFLLANSLYKIPVKDGPSRSHKKHETFASQWHCYWTDFQPHFILSLHCRKILRISHIQGVLTSFGWKAFSEPKLEIGFFRQKLVILKGYLHCLTDM